MKTALYLLVALSMGSAFHPARGSAQSMPSPEDEVLGLVNEERWANGQLPPLKGNSQLASAAEAHSTNMAERDFFAHCDLDTHEGPGDRIAASGYVFNAWGENIAAGYSTPAAVMSAWMNSSGHRANILSTNVRELGVGYNFQSADAGNVRGDANGDCSADSYSNGPYRHYWTQDFGRSSSVYPVIINREAFATVTTDVDLYVYGAGWAQEMRFRNEGGDWSAWAPYTPNVAWTLSSGNGTKTVYAEIRNGSSVLAAEDQIVLGDIVPVVPTTWGRVKARFRE